MHDNLDCRECYMQMEALAKLCELMSFKLVEHDLTEVHKALRTLNKCHLSVASWMKICHHIPEVVVSSNGYSMSVSGLLIFLLQGLLPMLTTMGKTVKRYLHTHNSMYFASQMKVTHILLAYLDALKVID